MRTRLNVPSELLKELAQLHAGKSISRAVEQALKDLMRRKGGRGTPL